MPDRFAYTVAEDATEPEVGAVCGAVLIALWADLAWFEIDLSGLGHDAISEQCVAALEDRRRKRLLSQKLESSAHLEPGPDDALLPLVLPLLTRTVGSTGLERERSRIIFSADDQGTACVFSLTAGEVDTVHQQLAGNGLRGGLLVRTSPR